MFECGREREREREREIQRENKVEQNEIIIPTYNNTTTKQRSDFTLYGK